MMVNKERVQLLVDALKSGKYKQGFGYLRRALVHAETPTYCCLGVACAVAIDNGLELDVVENSQGYTFYDHEHTVLPEPVKEWYGFDHVWGIIVPYGNRPECTACDLNDDLELPFPVIADIFAETYLGGEGDGEQGKSATTC